MFVVREEGMFVQWLIDDVVESFCPVFSHSFLIIDDNVRQQVKWIAIERVDR
jgi:hypothetical protein